MTRPDLAAAFPGIDQPIGYTRDNKPIYAADAFRRIIEIIYERTGGAGDEVFRASLNNAVSDSRMAEFEDRFEALETAVSRTNVSDRVQGLADRLDALERATVASPQDIAQAFADIEARIVSATRELELKLSQSEQAAQTAREQQADQLRSLLRDSIAQQALSDPVNVLASAGLRIDPDTGGVVIDALTLDGAITGAGLPLPVASGGTGAQTASAALTNLGGVASTRQISAGTGLAGGGSLAADRTLSLANTAVSAGSYGNATNVATFTVDAQGRLSAASNQAISFPVSSVAGRTGAVTLAQADISGLTTASSPTFAGINIGALSFSIAGVTAAIPASFSAAEYLAISTSSGTRYIPLATATW